MHSYADLDDARVTKRKFAAQNHALFTQYLENETWSSVYTSRNTNEAYQLFTDKVTAYFNICFPVTSVRKQDRQKGPQGHPSVRSLSLRAKVADLTHIYQTTGAIEDKELLSAAQKVYKNSLANDVRERNDSFILAAANQQKAMWEVVNKERNSKRSEETLCIHDGGENVTDPYNQGNILNEAFLNKPKEAKVKTKRICEQAGINGIAEAAPTPTPSFQLSLTHTEEVLKTIRSMKNTNACGPDNISTNLLKRNADHLAGPLAFIANLSFIEGTFPTQLLTTKVIPVFKRKGSKRDKNSYRPIALTSVFSKLLEKLFKIRLTGFLLENKILSPQQFGFQAGKSTIDAIVEALEEIAKNSDAKLRTIVSFLDLTAAFDCVDHTILLRKLELIGFSDLPLSWIRTFLENREQYVFVDGVESQVQKVTMGVPQGTVLGPLLYLIYVNSILKQSKNAKIIMFADDTSAAVKGRTLRESAVNCEAELQTLRLEFAAHGLLLNESKTNVIIMHQRASDVVPEIKLGEVTLTASPHARFLGVEIDSGLNWTAHVDQLNHKLHCNLFVLRRLSVISSRKVALQAFHALVMSHIDYGILAWGGTSAANLSMILGLQKRGIRHILGLNFMESCREHFKELKVLTVPALYIFKCVMLVSNTLHQVDVSRNGDTHDYHTRNRNDVRPEHHRLVSCDKSIPLLQGQRFVRRLPDTLQNLVGHVTFKTKLKDFLTDNAFYTLSEFTDQ